MVSRRERPSKPALTRAGVVAAAVAIMESDGLAKVTMRRVADALDTGHASLYVYVADTEDLHAQVLDAHLKSVRMPPSVDGSWRDRLKGLLSSYGEVLFAHPDLARTALSTQPTGPHYAALVETVLGLLGEGGVTGRAAAWGMDLLLLYPTAVAAEHAEDTPPRAARRAEARSLQVAVTDPGTYPRIAALGGELVSGDGRSRTDWALDVLLDGVLTAATRS